MALLFGALLLAPACAEESPVRDCRHDGVDIPVGQTFADGCKSCVCGDDERVTCTATHACDACTVDGEGYKVGEAYPAGDGCNICFCQESGEGECTMSDCG